MPLYLMRVQPISLPILQKDNVCRIQNLLILELQDIILCRSSSMAAAAAAVPQRSVPPTGGSCLPGGGRGAPACLHVPPSQRPTHSCACRQVHCGVCMPHLSVFRRNVHLFSLKMHLLHIDTGRNILHAGWSSLKHMTARLVPNKESIVNMFPLAAEGQQCCK